MSHDSGLDDETMSGGTPDDEPQIERLPRCGYGVGAPTEDGVDDCGEPAVCRIRWGGGEWLYLCERHYKTWEAAQS